MGRDEYHTFYDLDGMLIRFWKMEDKFTPQCNWTKIFDWIILQKDKLCFFFQIEILKCYEMQKLSNANAKQC